MFHVVRDLVWDFDWFWVDDGSWGVTIHLRVSPCRTDIPSFRLPDSLSCSLYFRLSRVSLPLSSVFRTFKSLVKPGLQCLLSLQGFRRSLPLVRFVLRSFSNDILSRQVILKNTDTLTRHRRDRFYHQCISLTHGLLDLKGKIN